MVDSVSSVSAELGYVVLFGAAALACFGALGRTRTIEDPDTRRGLVWLLLTSGGWATAHVGFLAAPGIPLKLAFYQIGLVVGLSAVGAWLYFTSAYTGRTMHRHRTYRRIAVAVFLAIVLLKVTNPIHHLYYTVEAVTTPFPHLAIHNGIVHWSVMGLSYALASIGYFMLFEMFAQVSHDTRPLAVLVSITGLPVVLDIVGVASPRLIDITYEPVGVAVFAVGVLVAYRERFQRIRLAGNREDAVVVLDRDDRIRDYNREALSRFPGLDDAIGEPLDRAIPALAGPLDDERSILEMEQGGEPRYYRLTENPFSTTGQALGRLLVITDITHRERYRKELERQNERLDQFANMVSHDLRNPLTVATGNLDLVASEVESDYLERARAALDRMDALIEDVLALARQGQPIDDLEPVPLASVVRESWAMVDAPAATLDVEADGEILADRSRSNQLFENLFRNAVEHAGPDVTVRVGWLADGEGFFVEDDGPGIPPDEREDVFGSGYTTAESGTGFGLAIVEEIAGAHGWDVSVRDSDAGGVRFEITGVESP